MLQPELLFWLKCTKSFVGKALPQTSLGSLQHLPDQELHLGAYF